MAHELDNSNNRIEEADAGWPRGVTPAKVIPDEYEGKLPQFTSCDC